jgi:hypothetical protein
MLNVYLCHASEDCDIAHQIAQRLESTAECRVLEDATGNIPANWDGGMACDSILLLLSRHSVPAQFRRDDWEALLQHATGKQDPPVAWIALEDAPWPKLIERRNFYRWTAPPLQALRAVERFVIAVHPPSTRQPFQPAKPGWVDHTPELESLWDSLVDRCGSILLTGPGHSGKSALAQRFAHEACEHFRDVLWIGCGDRSLSSLACEIAANFGTTLEGEIKAACRQLAAQLANHRLLLVLDDVRADISCAVPQNGFVSTLITARNADLLPSFARVTLCARPPHTPPPPDSANARRLWQAMSACFAACLPLDVAAGIAGLSNAEASEAAGLLSESQIIHPVDASGSWYRLAVAHPSPLAAEHATAVHRIFQQWAADPDRCLAAIREVPSAVRRTLRGDWGLAADLGRWAFALLRTRNRHLEAAELLELVLAEATRRGDGKTAEECKWELSWIRTGGDPLVQLPNAGATQLSLF